MLTFAVICVCFLVPEKLWIFVSLLGEILTNHVVSSHRHVSALFIQCCVFITSRVAAVV